MTQITRLKNVQLGLPWIQCMQVCTYQYKMFRVSFLWNTVYVFSYNK